MQTADEVLERKALAPDLLKRMQAEIYFRDMTVEPDSIDQEARTVQLAFSSEAPVNQHFGTEILDHGKKSVRMDRLNNSAPLLLNHDPNKQIGVVVPGSASIGKDGVGRATVKISRSQLGEEILQDMIDGIRPNTSVGYRIHAAQLEESGDTGDTYRITDWEPFEVTSASVPADGSVGIGRSESGLEVGSKAGARPEIKEEGKREITMSEEVKTPQPAPAPDLTAERTKAGEEATRAERTRVNEISAIADRAAGIIGEKKAADMAREAIQSDKGVDAFREDMQAALIADASQKRSPSLGLSQEEVDSFRFVRMLYAMSTGDWSKAGFEREVCDATSKRTGIKSKGKRGAIIPTDILSRALNTTAAASSIQTDVLAGSFIDLLRNRMLVRALGATILGNLQGNVELPRLSGGATAYWVAEGAALTESDQTLDNVTLSPKGVAAETQVTTQTLIQSSLDIEALIRTDLAKVIALAIDLASINGSGAGSQPTGILQTAGIGSVAMGTNGAALADMDPLIDLETAIASANADVDSMAYLTNAKVVGALKKLKTTTNEYLWTRADADYPTKVPGGINGYMVGRTNQMPSNFTKGTGTNLSGIIMGNWSDLVIGEWGALDLQVDPYTGGMGNIIVKALQFVDVGVRHAESFAAVTDIIA